MMWKSRKPGAAGLLLATVSTVAGTSAGFLLATSVSVPATAEETTTQCVAAAAPTKILLFGDSQTHAFSANWTWRYRLWQSLTESGASFDFVGPRTDVVEYATLKMNSRQYRTMQFDRDHASLMNMRFLYGYYQLDGLAEDYHPDIVVASIGGNDLFKGADLATLRAHWLKQITQAREHAPGVDIVLVQLPQIWFNRFPAYNTMLSEVAEQLDTSDERVIVTQPAELGRWTDTIDQAHLSTSGERKVANVVAKALATLGVGSGEPASTPDPADDHTAWAPQPTATVDGVNVTVTWPAVTYASSVNVWVRYRATGATGVKRYVTGTSTVLTGTAGRSYDLWLAPVQGFMPIGTTSKTIQVDIPPAEPTPEPTPEPTTAEPTPEPTPEPTASPDGSAA